MPTKTASQTEFSWTAPEPGLSEVADAYRPDLADRKNWSAATIRNFLDGTTDPLDFPKLAEWITAIDDPEVTARARELFQEQFRDWPEADIAAHHAALANIHGELSDDEMGAAMAGASTPEVLPIGNRRIDDAHAVVALWLERGYHGVIDPYPEYRRDPGTPVHAPATEADEGAPADDEGPDFDRDGLGIPEGEDVVTAEQLFRARDGIQDNRPGKLWLHCPAKENHNNADLHPSLLVYEDQRGHPQPYVSCMAGCDQDEVWTAFGERHGIHKPQDHRRRMNTDTHPSPARQCRAVPQWTPVVPVPEEALTPPFYHPHHGEPSQIWTYRDKRGEVTGYTARFDLKDAPKAIKPYVYAVNQEEHYQWRWLTPEARSIYGLDRLEAYPDLPIHIHEGEKAADAGAELLSDGVNIAWAGGTNAIRAVDWAALTDYRHRTVYIFRDNDEPGERAARRIAETLFERNFADVRIVDPPTGVPEKWDLADALDKNWTREDALSWLAQSQREPHDPAEGGPRSVTPDDPFEMIVRKFNRKHACVIIGGKQRVLMERYDAITEGVYPVFLSEDDFKKHYHRLPSINVAPPDKEPKWKKPAQVWLDSPLAREYQDIVFSPGEQTPDCYNLWRGFNLDPDPGGSCDLFLDHIFTVIAGEDDYTYHYVLSWLAQIVQNPQEGPGTALTLRGNQGSGKGTFADYIGELFGQHYKHVTDPKHITGRFNQHLADTLILFADEAFFAGDKTAIGTLKSLITDRIMMVEQKGVDAFVTRNYVNVLISSNNDWVVPAESSDRRFCVVDVADTYRTDKSYFHALHQQMRSGGLGAFLHFLLTYDLDAWGIDFEEFPETQARTDQKLHSLSPTLKWLHKLAETHDLGHLVRPSAETRILQAAGDWENQPVMVATEELWEDLCLFIRSLGARNAPAHREMKRAIERAVPSAASGKTRQLGGRSPNAYVELPPRPQFRHELAAYIGIPEDAL